MKRYPILLAMVCAATCQGISAAATSELALGDVRLHLRFPSRTLPGKDTTVSLSFSNATGRVGCLRLPSALPRMERRSEPPRLPYLALVVRKEGSGKEEGLVWTTTSTNIPSIGGMVLPPGGVHSVDYNLSSFYRWGPCDVDRYGDFTAYFKPGPVDLTVVAMIYYEGEDGPRLRSNAQTLSCSFPEWLFKEADK